MLRIFVLHSTFTKFLSSNKFLQILIYYGLVFCFCFCFVLSDLQLMYGDPIRHRLRVCPTRGSVTYPEVLSTQVL
jgi:hypothetical protein